MALIKCPECGKEISDTSNQCIHCGYVFKNSTSKNSNNDIVVKEIVDSLYQNKKQNEIRKSSTSLFVFGFILLFFSIICFVFPAIYWFIKSKFISIFIIFGVVFLCVSILSIIMASSRVNK